MSLKYILTKNTRVYDVIVVYELLVDSLWDLLDKLLVRNYAGQAYNIFFILNVYKNLVGKFVWNLDIIKYVFI